MATQWCAECLLAYAVPLTTKVEKIEVTRRRDKDEDAYDAT